MPENLDNKATNDLASSYVDCEAARRIGFRDGFIGESARAVSDFIDQQTAYFDAFKEGRAHREQVDEMCAKESIDHNDLVKKALDFYYFHHYGSKRNQ